MRRVHRLETHSWTKIRKNKINIGLTRDVVRITRAILMSADPRPLTSVAAVPCSVFDQTVDGIEDFFEKRGLGEFGFKHFAGLVLFVF